MAFTMRDAARIWEEVKENHRRLSECAGPHVFRRQNNGRRDTYRCEKCGGVVDDHGAYWYLQALKHVGLDPKNYVIEEASQ